MGPTCSETSVTNYQPTLPNIPEERRSQQNITCRVLYYSSCTVHFGINIAARCCRQKCWHLTSKKAAYGLPSTCLFACFGTRSYPSGGNQWRLHPPFPPLTSGFFIFVLPTPLIKNPEPVLYPIRAKPVTYLADKNRFQSVLRESNTAVLMISYYKETISC
jgi:hypothetical protein